MKSTLLSKHLTEYFDTYLPQTRGYSKNTVNAYLDSFALFFRFLEETLNVPQYSLDYKHMSGKIVEQYLLWLATTRNCCPATCNHRLSAISSFFKFASKKDLKILRICSEIIDIPIKKGSEKIMPYFTLEEMGILLSLPSPRKRLERRDIVLLSFLYDSAARVQELCDITVRDVRFGNPTKVLLVGKGGNGRLVPIMPKTSSILRQHINENGLNGTQNQNTPLFSSQTHIKMTRSCVSNIVSKYVGMAKEKQPNLFPDAYSPHSFRHSKAVHMLEAGSELIYIRDFLGHKSIQTTEIYAVVSQHMVIKALKERKIPEPTPSLAPINTIDTNAIPVFLKKRN